MLPRKAAVGHLVTLVYQKHLLSDDDHFQNRWTNMNEKEAGRREKVSHYLAKNPFNSRLLIFNQVNQLPSSPVAMCNENSTVVWSGRDVFHFLSVCECLLVKDIRCEGTQLWESESESECALELTSKSVLVATMCVVLDECCDQCGFTYYSFPQEKTVPQVSTTCKLIQKKNGKHTGLKREKVFSCVATWWLWFNID